MPKRQITMEPTTPPTSKHLTRRIAALAIVLAIVASACGSDNVIVGSADDDPGNTPVSAPADDAVPVPEPAIDDVVSFDDVDGTVIGTANMGGEIVDPKPAKLDGFAVAESYPEQIQVEFTAAAEGCTAATAQAIATSDTVTIVLEVGITTDALVKTCPAGEFTHMLSIALTEGLDGREVMLATP